MAVLVHKNNQAAIEYLLRQGYGDDITIEWPKQTNGGTNKSSYEVIVNGKSLFAVVVEPPEVNPAHGLTPDEARRKHEFFASISERVSDIPIRDNIDNSSVSEVRNTITANFSNYIQINGKAISELAVESESADKVFNKAIYITDNYVANDRGRVIEAAHHVTEAEAYIYGRAYVGILERATKDANVRNVDLKEVFGHSDPYNPRHSVANLNQILADEEKYGSVGVCYITQRDKQKERETGETIVCSGPDIEREGLNIGKQITERLISAADKIKTEYEKISGSLKQGLVHGDPWFDNIIQHFEPTINRLESGISPLNRIKSIVIDIENAGVGYRAMDIAMAISSMNGLDLKTGEFTPQAKAFLRGADEVKHLEAGFEDKFYLLYAASALYIANMRLDKWANGDGSKRSPISEIEKAEEAISKYLEAKKISLNNILTPPTTTVLKEQPHVAARFQIEQS